MDGAAAFAFLLLASASALAQPDEQRRVFDAVAPTVVALRNEEGYGSGMILNEKGLILTNAHVIVSPLPYQVEAEGVSAKGPGLFTFKRVTLLGVHPERDLALVQIDPAEHGARLRPIDFSTSRVITRDPVHLIGFPSKYGGHAKIITSGEVTGINQFVDMPGYFEFSIEAHTGNSGGPACSADGKAVGVLTFKLMDDGEPTAWAIPLHDFQPGLFIPLEQRLKNPAQASELLRRGEEALKWAGRGSGRAAQYAEMYFTYAILTDISNADTYFKIGLIKRNRQKHAAAAAYLIRSLTIQPWPESQSVAYYELGAALAQMNRMSDAVAVWNEGLAKHPATASMTWGVLSVWHFDRGEYFKAALASRAAVRTFTERADTMNQVYAKSYERLTPGEQAELRSREGALPADLARRQADADQARQEGRAWMTEEGRKAVLGYDGVQKEARDFTPRTPDRTPTPAAEVPLLPPEELTARLIVARTQVAKDHLRSGRKDLALPILEDIVQNHPDHPDAQGAKVLLDLLKKKP